MGTRLYVGNLPYDADEPAIRAAFEQDGRVVGRVHIPLDRETQRPRGAPGGGYGGSRDREAPPRPDEDGSDGGSDRGQHVLMFGIC